MSALVKPRQTIDGGEGGCWGQQEVRNGVCGELQVLETHDGRPGVMKGCRTSGFLLQSCAHLQPSTSRPVQVCVRVCAVVQNSRKLLHTLTHLPSCIDKHGSPPSRAIDLDFSPSSSLGGGSYVAGGYATVAHTDHDCDGEARLRGDPCNIWQNASPHIAANDSSAVRVQEGLQLFRQQVVSLWLSTSDRCLICVRRDPINTAMTIFAQCLLGFAFFLSVGCNICTYHLATWKCVAHRIALVDLSISFLLF